MTKKKKKNKNKNSGKEIRTMYLVWALVTTVRNDGMPEDLTKDNIIGMADIQNNWQVSERGSYIARDKNEKL
jgi:hypothetical protein